MPGPSDNREFVSIPHFASLVDLSERTVWKLIRRRQVLAYRVGRRTLIKVDEGVASIQQIGRNMGEQAGEDRSETTKATYTTTSASCFRTVPDERR